MAAEPPAASAAPPGAEAQLKELQDAVASLQARGLGSDRQLAAAAATTADLEAQARGLPATATAALVAAYGRRVQRLVAVLQQYEARLQQALAALGLPQQHGQGTQSAESASLSDHLHHLEQQLAAALDVTGGAGPTADALLCLGSGAPAAADVAGAGPGAILAQLQAGVEADIHTVDHWPSLLQPPDAADPAASASGASAALGRLQTEQKEQWEAAAQRRQQLQELRAAVAAAQAALADGSACPDAAAAARTRLAAQQAGLRAELSSLDAAQRVAGEQAAAAAQRGKQVQEQRDRAAALEQQEEALDAAVRALCCADSQVMRQWRQGTWRAQEALDAGVLSQRQPLAQLSQQLLRVQQQELAAFQRHATERAAAAHQAAGSSEAPNPVAAAAQLLDPLAHLKTPQHAAAVVAAARSELAELQPVVQQWADLAAACTSELAGLQQTAAGLEARVGELQQEGGSAALQQLRQAAAAAEEGAALVGAARQALTEWWTSPAVTAAPWVKREGRSTEEWLRLLGDQQRLLRQREAFADASNRRRH